MSTSTSSLSNVYLTKESGELVVREGTNPNKEKHHDKRVLVVGGGVTGLTVSNTNSRPLIKPLITLQNAWALLDAGYSVTVVSDRWASLEDRITSQIAGAL